jgi:hypothetical protein
MHRNEILTRFKIKSSEKARWTRDFDDVKHLHIKSCKILHNFSARDFIHKRKYGKGCIPKLSNFLYPTFMLAGPAARRSVASRSRFSSNRTSKDLSFGRSQAIFLRLARKTALLRIGQATVPARFCNYRR